MALLPADRKSDPLPQNVQTVQFSPSLANFKNRLFYVNTPLLWPNLSLKIFENDLKSDMGPNFHRTVAYYCWLTTISCSLFPYYFFSLCQQLTQVRDILRFTYILDLVIEDRTFGNRVIDCNFFDEQLKIFKFDMIFLVEYFFLF